MRVGHFSQILFESMRPSPHRRHLTAIHGALLSLCKHMAAPIRTLAGQPDTLFAEPIPEPSGGVSGSDDFGFEIMECVFGPQFIVSLSSEPHQSTARVHSF